jgi:hypothetical protein
MKNKVVLGLAASLTAMSSAFADLSTSQVSGGLLAGWDFADVANVSADVNTYASERNGVGVSGTLYTDGSNSSSALTQVSAGSSYQTRFVSYGRATSAQAGTRAIGGPATGQQAVQFTNSSSSFDIVFGLSSAANDVLVEFDWMTSGTLTSDAYGDWLNVSYSADGVSFTELNPNTNDDIVGSDFYAADSANSWTASSTTGGLLTLASGQSNSAIDLTAAGNVQYIKFSVGAVNSGAELYLDNVSITGTVVPEPSTYAAIFGVVALAIAAYRRRK